MLVVDRMHQSCGFGSRCCGPIPSIFLKENNSLILENSRRVEFFCKNTPEPFCNYILVPALLHLGPCLTFHNYN
jgi:hypothetical protein